MTEPLQTNRRRFLCNSASLALGLAASGATLLAGDTPEDSTLQGLDAELAAVLRSYGRAGTMTDQGTRKIRHGKRTTSLPVSRVVIEVSDRDSFVRSFGELARLSERVEVEGNNARFARGGRYFILENRLA